MLDNHFSKFVSGVVNNPEISSGIARNYKMSLSEILPERTKIGIIVRHTEIVLF
jgi:hypothetical protein